MTKHLLLFALAVCPLVAISQAQLSDPARPGVNPFRDDQNARAVYNKPDDLNAEGSPYLIDEYIPMEITLEKGGIFPDIKVKINVVDNEILFLTESGVEMATATPVKRLRYSRVKEDASGMEEVILESFGTALNTKGAPMYEVLVDGKARLLKHILISYADVRKYPEGIMARVFKKKSSYYASVNNQPPVKMDKSKSDVLAVFPDKQSQMLSFVEKEKLKCRTEADIIKVFQYYSTL